MACCEKYKALILKYVPYISKYMAYIFCFFKYLKNKDLQKAKNAPFFRAVLASFLVRLWRF